MAANSRGAAKSVPPGTDLETSVPPGTEVKKPADKPKAKRRPKAKPISENPAASLSLLARARRR